MLERVKEILAEQLDMEISEIGDNTDLQEELEVDSLDIMDIMTEIEEEFSIEVEDEDIENLKTAKKIADYIESKK